MGIQNEKVAKDFQFEWETNAGKALTMLSSLIETMGDKREGGRESKESFERKLSQIRRFLLAQDARVEMNQVKSSIQRVGNERYTPEVTAYLMEQALNASTERLSGEESVYKRATRTCCKSQCPRMGALTWPWLQWRVLPRQWTCLRCSRGPSPPPAAARLSR